MVDKPCLVCEHADLTKIVRGSMCGGDDKWICFDCTKCELIGAYGERDLRTEQILHDVVRNTYHIDGGESSSACRNFQMHDDFSPENIDNFNRDSMLGVLKP